MSRHSRQRHRRFRKTLSKIPEDTINAIASRWNNTGLFPRWAKPLEVIAAKRYLGIR